MSKYLKIGQEYLNIPTTLEKANFMDNVVNVMPRYIRSKFYKWTNDVEKWESHRDGKKPKQWYLDLLRERIKKSK